MGGAESMPVKVTGKKEKTITLKEQQDCICCKRPQGGELLNKEIQFLVASRRARA